jgi:hypothetical protein
MEQLYLVIPSFIDLFDYFDFVREDFGLFKDIRPSAKMEARPVSAASRINMSGKIFLGLSIINTHIVLL